jgi:glycosyltransferase involved in cell wall biosynthesis
VKVLVAAASYGTSISGVQRHAFNLARCLLQLREVSELHLVIAPWQCELAERAGIASDPRITIHIGDMARSSISRNLWYWFRLPQLAAHVEADVVHFSYPMPLNSSAFNCPTIVTLHDLYPYEIPMNFGFPKFIFNRLVLKQCLHAAWSIACVSDATRKILRRYAPAVSRKATTIYNCVDAGPLAGEESPIPGWGNEPFLLCVAQHRRNKNIGTLIRAFDRLIGSGWIEVNTKLVVIGTRGPETSGIRSLVNDLRLTNRVHFLENLSEPQLQWCYGHCDALVAPSITEGFDLPIAEGLLTGCRIVCSDIAVHREIGGDQCRYVSLRENPAEQLAAVIADTLNEPKPPSFALPQFSSPVLAKQYLTLYKNLLEASAPQVTSEAHSFGSQAAREAIAITDPESQSALLYRGR